jgi:hypothetical protein
VLFRRRADAAPTRRISRFSRPRTAICGAILAALFAILLTIASFASAQQPEEQSTIIHGTVVNQITGDPVPRALVHSFDDRYATLTDGDGHFEFDLPKDDTNSAVDSALQSYGLFAPRSRAGRISLSARKPGFVDDRRNPSQVRAIPGSETMIPLVPEALIKGRITLSTGDSAERISVWLFSQQIVDGQLRWTSGQMVQTNSSGEFRFADLRPGAYKLATHESMDNDPISSVPGGQPYGFPPVYFPAATDLAGATSIDVTGGQTAEADLSLTRQPYYRVRIPVTNAEGGVGISVEGQHGPGYSLSYNAGQQRIEGSLPNGTYVVQASTGGAEAATGTESIKVAGTPVEGAPITLTRNSSITLQVSEEFTDPNWSPPTGTISEGQHTYSLRGPRTYLNVQAENTDDFAQRPGGWMRPPRADNDDSLVIENLVPGRYWLRINPTHGYVVSATASGVDLLHEPLMVGAGGTIPVEIKMRDDMAELSGSLPALANQAEMNGAGSGAAVSSAAALGNSSVWIYCVPLPNGPGQFEQTNTANATFDMPNMAPGDYRVLAFDRRFELPYRDAEAMRAYESKGQVVHLTAGQKATVQLEITPPSE